MRLDFVFDSFYVLSSVWGILPGSTVCAANPSILSDVSREVARPPVPRKPVAVTAFIEVNVVPMDSERILAKQTVLVEGERITALGPAHQVKIPNGAVRIDGRGKYLMPGLADMHAHLHMFFKHGTEFSERRMFRYLANGVTTVRHTGGMGHRPLYAHLQSPQVLGPRIYYGAPIPELDSLTPESVATYVIRQAPGYRFLFVPRGLFEGRRPMFDSLVAVARRLGLALSSHTNDESYEEMLAFGAARGSVEHMYPVSIKRVGKPGQSWAERPEAEIKAVAAEIKRAGVWITMTLVCDRAIFDSKTEWPMIRALQDAGVGLLLGVDLDGSGDLGGRNSPHIVHRELGNMVRAKLTPYEALLTGTRNVAQYFGLLDSSGTVAVGKWADLVLLRDNPLADIRNTREPDGVMIKGRWLDRTALDEGLAGAPKTWFGEEILFMNQETYGKLGMFEALIDSLESVAPPARASVMQRLADELGAIRGTLRPNQQEMFDDKVRVWLRVQARKGREIVVPGITVLR